MSSRPCFALPFVQIWEKVEGVKFFEYQISKTPDFGANDIVKSDRIEDTKVELNLNAGVYYFRIRSSGANPSESGRWSQVLQVPLVDEALTILNPHNGDKIPLLSQSSEIKVKWLAANRSIDDYQLHLTGPEHQNINVQTAEREVTVPRMSAGIWRLQLLGRKESQTILASPSIEIEILPKEKFMPRIVYPVDSDELWEFSEFDVKWIRKVPGLKSEILLARADHPGFPIIYREEIPGTGSFTMPGLSTGLYQLSLRDYDENSEEFAESTVTLRVIPNVHDLQPENIDITSRLIGGPFLGNRSISTPSMHDHGLSSQADALSGPQFEGQLEWRFKPSETIEGAMGSGSVSQNSAIDSTRAFVSDTPLQRIESYNGPTEGYLRLAYSRKIHTFRDSSEFWLKYFGEYQYWRAPVFDQIEIVANTSDTRSVYTMQNFGTLGLGIGASLKGRLRPQTHWELNAYIPLPLLVEKGAPAKASAQQLGTGKWAGFYFPKIEFLGLLRHKFSREFWVCLGVKSVLGFTSVREDSISQPRTRISEWSFSPRVGIDWDL